jgi:hypothetical protein
VRAPVTADGVREPSGPTAPTPRRTIPLPRLIRHATSLIAAVAVLATALLLAPAAGAAPGDLPDLVQSRPGNVAGGYFDDHSIAGDDHLAWSAPGSESEPLAVDFTTSVVDQGAGALEVCGYPSGVAGWMRAFQVTPGALVNACPPAPPPAGQMGWFRMVDANHSTTGAYNRWHLVDFQRFALVPLPPSLGGPAAGATAWDTYWGTCLNLGDPSLFCETNPAAAGLAVGIAPGAGKVTQDGAPDDQRIAIPADARGSFPDGAYQIIAISNPYGALAEAGTTSGSVACTTVTLANAPVYAGFTATASPAAPPTCYVPRTLPPALTGPGGRDPMASAGPTTPPCTLVAATGHCWATVPMSGANPPARSNTNATAAATIVATDTVPVPQGADYRLTATPPAPPPVVTPRTTRRLTARASRSHVRKALRTQFGKQLRRLRVSCRVRASTRSTCTVSWRKHGARYRGRVYIRLHTVKGRLRWQYRVDVRKRLHGRTTHIRRSYRTGGLA